MTADLVPITVIGGYLGAGKTTLLNQLLRGDHGRRLAVLVNDFGSVNIDADLIASHDGATIGLRNGCVCCSIADALGDALDRVLALDPPPEQVVIEASGVADPAKVATYGQGWPGCRLDAVIVLADAETIRRRARDDFVGELVTRQLRRADVVVLTKCDLVTNDVVEAVTSWVATHAPNVPVVATRDGRIDPALVLDVGASGSVPVTGWPDDDLPDATALFSSASVVFDGPVDRDALEDALRRWPDDVVRVKGIVGIVDAGGAVDDHVVHRVGRRWSIEPHRSSPLAGAAQLTGGAGRLVVIARRGTVPSLDGLGGAVAMASPT